MADVKVELARSELDAIVQAHIASMLSPAKQSTPAEASGGMPTLTPAEARGRLVKANRKQKRALLRRMTDSERLAVLRESARIKAEPAAKAKGEGT